MELKLFTLKNKMMLMILLAIAPFIAIVVYLQNSMREYSRAYDNIVSNITIANSYNLDFKEEIDDGLYIMVARNLSVTELENTEKLRNPYMVINELDSDLDKLLAITGDEESRTWLRRINNNTQTLEERVDDICYNIEIGGRYDKSIEMLENNIYILTELIQEDIQNYIYHQTKNIEKLERQLNSRINNFIAVCLILTVVVMAMVVLISSIFANQIISPIKKLVNVTHQISKGDFSARASVGSRDEIATLSDSVNVMSEKLQELVTTIKEDERRMRHTELRLLQEQINPHFLYNTLDTIVWLIESDKSEKAEEMVMSLSTFFRLVLSHGRDRITIADEEKHIRSYLEIQQVRYKEILDYKIEIDKEIYPYSILKLTLQPLVENALYHGIKYKRAKGTILVRGVMEDEKIILTVSDDGVGIDEKELNILKEQIKLPCAETGKGFGLANVNERIRMNFGSEYGMEIESKKEQGTSIRLTIPAVEYVGASK